MRLAFTECPASAGPPSGVTHSAQHLIVAVFTLLVLVVMGNRMTTLQSPTDMAQAKRDLPLTTARLTAVVSAVCMGLYLVLGVSPSLHAFSWLSALPVLAVVVWLERDAQRTRVGIHEIGTLAMFGWMVVIPWYAFKTRGRAGIWLMLGLFALMASPYIGAIATMLLLIPARLLGLWPFAQASGF